MHDVERIANALVHQDFTVSGASVMIEMYSDRVEISNPGIPPIQIDRFIDEFRSRNERLADLMRRLGMCEEKGSGIDKVVHAAEIFQLLLPLFLAMGAADDWTQFQHFDTRSTYHALRMGSFAFGRGAAQLRAVAALA